MRTSSSVLLGCLLILFPVRLIHAQWIQTNGPYGGYVNVLTAGGSNLYAGTSGGGVFISTNSGASWTGINTGLTDMNIQSLAASGTNLLAGTPYSVFLSTDNGTSWTQADFNRTGAIVSLYSVGFSGPDLLASDELGVFLSTDNGISWSATDLPSAASCFAAIGTNLIAGAGGGVFLSTNHGANWTPTSYAGAGVVALAVAGTNIYVGTGAANGVFVSGDTGATWTQIDVDMLSGLDALAVIDTNVFTGSQYGDGAYRLAEGGTWTRIDSGLANTTILSLATIGTKLFAGTSGGGVFLSTNNGESWNAVNSGLLNSFVNAMIFSPDSSGNLFAGTTGGGTYLSTDDGNSWTDAMAGFANMDIRAFAVLGTNLFAGSYGRGVFRSTNNGTTWAAVDTGLTNMYVRAFVVVGTDLYAGTGSNISGGVFRSTDDGASWTEDSSGLPNTPVYSLAARGTRIFAGTGGYTQGRGVYLSTDNGGSWTAVNSGLPANKRVYTLIASGQNLCAGINGGAYLSTDDGASWTEADSGLPNNVYALAADGPPGAENLFAGATSPSHGSGVYLSTNTGRNWTAVNLGLTILDVRALVVHGTNLFAGTRGGGVFRRPLSEFVVHTITASAGPNGTIKATGTITVEQGGSMTFTMRPHSGYFVDSVIVDDIKTDSATRYTFSNVTEDHTIRATFAMCLSTQEFSVDDKWNMVAVPASVSDYSKSTLFPTSVSSAFYYEDGYYEAASLTNGVGYWLKFSGAQNVQTTGCPQTEYSIDVMTGWNLIGSISAPVVTSTITSEPPGIGTSEFFGYRSGYVTTDTIQPGKGYWVKVDQDGSLFLTSSPGAALKSNRIRIVASNERPPSPPDGPGTPHAALPLQYALEQAYPNPFNPTTQITYAVPRKADVTVKVYDVLGRDVATLVDGMKEPGTYTVTWEAECMASGLYFYRMVAGNFVQTRKMILMR